MSLPDRKAQKITDLIRELRLRGHCMLRQIQCLLGYLNFASFVIHRGRLHCRHLQRFSTQFLQRRPWQKLAITSKVQGELEWWQGATNSSVLLHKGPIANFLTTDAADPGWGAQLDGSHIAGSWTRSQRRWHSNKKEMFALYVALKQMAHRHQGAHILLQTDNRTLVAYIRKEGGTSSTGSDLPNSPDARRATDNPVSSLSPRQIERDSRQTVKKENSPRVAFTSFRYKRDLRKMGSTGHRSFRISKFGRSQTLCFTRLQRSICRLHRRLESSMEMQTRMGLPSPKPIAQSTGPSEQMEGSFPIVAPRWDQTFWLADLTSRSKEPHLTLQNLENVLIDLSTNLPPQQVERLTLQVWKVGCGKV